MKHKPQKYEKKKRDSDGEKKLETIMANYFVKLKKKHQTTDSGSSENTTQD